MNIVDNNVEEVSFDDVPVNVPFRMDGVVYIKLKRGYECWGNECIYFEVTTGNLYTEEDLDIGSVILYPNSELVLKK